MTIRSSALAATAALILLTACGKNDAGGNATATPAAPTPAAAASGATDWTQTTSVAPGGGYVIGNPDAAVKLVEYGALTCPHCAAFEQEAKAPLTEMIRTGKVSWEFRTFMIHPLDLPVSVLVRCEGPGPFPALLEQTYAAQPEWIGNVQKLSEADLRAMNALPQQQQLGAFVKASKLDAFFRQRGLSQAKIDACLTDEKKLQQVADLTKLGTDTDKISGTPSFLVNGVLQQDVFGWAQLKPKLDAALAG